MNKPDTSAFYEKKLTDKEAGKAIKALVAVIDIMEDEAEIREILEMVLEQFDIARDNGTLLGNLLRKHLEASDGETKNS